MTKQLSFLPEPPSRAIHALAEALFLQVGERRWPVASIQDASHKFSAVRDRMGVGGSGMPPAVIVGGGGEPRYRISYNGKVWASDGRDWQPGDVPVFNPYAA